MSLDYKVFSGTCPDESCKTKLYFAAHKTTSECPNCGQRHSQNELHNVEEVTDGEEAITQVLKSIVWDIKLPKKGSDSVKVNGLSNYHCKLLSPLFTHYGMDKEGNPRLLSELGHGETADCGRLLCRRAFLISPDHIDIVGFGRDQSGSVRYLQGLLDIMKDYHNGQELLIPIHADGDGHCLVHALSRATTGREIFWHALRDNLVSHLEKNLKTYQNLFKDFHDVSDWRTIIEEADPYHTSTDGFHVGLGNIHIFALANVLKRPIVLLDSLKGIENVADYTGIFVPALVDPGQCRGNLPLCVAWSGAGHNHFVPLVGVAGRPAPCIPPALIPNIWGIDKECATQYLTFNNDGSLTVAGGKPLQRGYLLKLVAAIEKVFLERYSVSAALVSDMHLYVYQRVGFVGLHPNIVIDKTREAVASQRVFRCLLCGALSQLNGDETNYEPEGFYFKLMTETHGTPDPNKVYYFPMDELECKYDTIRKRLVPYQFPCAWCKNRGVRRVDRLGNILYRNGDPTKTPTEIPNSCCGYKHFWDGIEYENVPKTFEINLTLRGKSIEEEINWFYNDSDASLNSDLTSIARDIAEKYFGCDSELDDRTEKIKIAIKSRLKELEIPDEDICETMDFQSTSNMETSGHINSACKKKTPLKGVSDAKYKMGIKACVPKTNKQNVSKLKLSGVDIPSTSKRALMKRELDGTIKPPSPPVPRQNIKNPQPSDGTDKTSLKIDEKAKEVRIRISTSDGRQKTLLVKADLQYNDLLKTVEMEFSILPLRQVLKLGFPPKILSPGGQSLGLHSGDRVMVEIKVEKSTEKKNPGIRKIEQRETLKTSWAAERSAGSLQSLVNLLPLTKPVRDEPVSSANLDASLNAVSKMAQITGKATVWDYSVNHPELFLPGGVFYNQFRRDIGLINGRHCMLPLLPGRVFRYNSDHDRVELCLEPTGHFPIDPGIHDIIESTQSLSGLQGPTEDCAVSQQVDMEAVSSDDRKNKPADLKELTTVDDLVTRPLQKVEGYQSSEVKGESIAPTTEDPEESMEVESESSEVKGASVAPIIKDLEGQSSRKGQIQHERTDASTMENNKKVESKLGPGFVTVGPQPTPVSPEEASKTRQRLMEALKAKKQTTD